MNFKEVEDIVFESFIDSRNSTVFSTAPAGWILPEQRSCIPIFKVKLKGSTSFIENHVSVGDEAIYMQLNDKVGIKIIHPTKATRDSYSYDSVENTIKNINRIKKLNLSIFPEIHDVKLIKTPSGPGSIAVLVEHVEGSRVYDDYDRYSWLVSDSNRNYLRENLKLSLDTMIEYSDLINENYLVPDTSWFKVGKNLINGKIVDFQRWRFLPKKYTFLNKENELFYHKLNFMYMSLVRNASVLDLDCGFGAFSAQSIIHGAKKTVATELNKDFFLDCVNKNKSTKLSFVNEDSWNYLLKNKSMFDIIMVNTFLRYPGFNPYGNHNFLRQLSACTSNFAIIETPIGHISWFPRRPSLPENSMEKISSIIRGYFAQVKPCFTYNTSTKGCIVVFLCKR